MAHKKILVIEDVIEHQKIAGHALAHHEVMFATNVEEALERLRKTHFDLILLDINLPTRNGYSLLTELRSDPRYDEKFL